MLSKIVVGYGDALALALAGWRDADPALQIEAIALSQDASYRFDLSVLDKFDASQTTAFVALDHQFLNFRRFEMMGEMKSRGFKLPPLVCRGALVAADVRIQENCLIGAGAIVGCNSRIGFNTVIGAGTNVGMGCEIGNSVWIEPGVLLGKRVKIGSNAMVGGGVRLHDTVEIGRQCIIDRPGDISRNVAAKTYVHSQLAAPVHIIDRAFVTTPQRE